MGGNSIHYSHSHILPAAIRKNLHFANCFLLEQIEYAGEIFMVFPHQFFQPLEMFRDGNLDLNRIGLAVFLLGSDISIN